MQYLLDTSVLIRHFTGKGKIGSQALPVFESLETGEDSFIISIISLMEIMYLAEKNRIKISLKETLDIIDSSSRYAVVDLNSEILKVAETVDFPELHDRLILATAKWLEIKTISSDREFQKVKEIEVLWD